MDSIYDRIGIDYAVKRCTDPVIAQQLYSELRGATRIVNIGAGTGSYEMEGANLVAVEPSLRMIAQRRADACPVTRAFAEALPFDDDSFSHAMTVLSMHHWQDRARAFREINRVATNRFVAITWDPQAAPFWLTRDYFPEIHAMGLRTFPSLAELERAFGGVESRPLPIPADCKDGFLAAFWKRPGAYLSPEVRQSMSAFAELPDLRKGLARLRDDLNSGAWRENNRGILELNALDAGYRLITARVRKT